MKKLLYSLLLVAIAFALFLVTYKVYLSQKAPKVIAKVDTVLLKPEKIVFMVTAKNVDFDKMVAPDIVKKIEEDTEVGVKSTQKLDVGGGMKIVKVYKVEDITCPYLKKRFKDNKPGEMVYEYNGKMLVKCYDGVLKLYHGHSPKDEKAGLK